MPFECTWTPFGSRPLKYFVVIVPRGFLASFFIPDCAPKSKRPNVHRRRRSCMCGRPMDTLALLTIAIFPTSPLRPACTYFHPTGSPLQNLEMSCCSRFAARPRVPGTASSSRPLQNFQITTSSGMHTYRFIPRTIMASK